MLAIDDLSLVYPNGFCALRSITLRAERGEIVAIIGRSGAGKSTLLRCINGLQRTTTGRITLQDADVTAMDEGQLEALRRRIGFIWQEYNLVDRLPVLMNVLTGRLGYQRGLAGHVGYFDRAHREVALRNLARVAREDGVLTLISIHSAGTSTRPPAAIWPPSTSSTPRCATPPSCSTST